MHGLEVRPAVVAEVAGGCDAEAAGVLAGDVGEDVAVLVHAQDDVQRGREPHDSPRGGLFRMREVAPISFQDIESQDDARQLSGIEEFDRVLGGGIVPGSLVLIGGDPGIGK